MTQSVLRSRGSKPGVSAAAARMIHVDRELARRLERADALEGAECAHALARLRPESGAAVEPVAGGYAIFTGVGSPLSEAKALGMDGAVSEAEMDRLEDFFRSRGDGVRIEVCPLADGSLVELLDRRGYRAAEFSNVLVRSLDPSETWPPPPRAIQVQKVTENEAELWAQTMARGFAGHFPITPELLEITRLNLATSDTQCLLARVNGELAGGAVLWFREGIAGVYGASTLPALRNLGVQTALIRARLAMASAAGCGLAMTATQVGSGSQRNVERQGFHVAYTRVKLIREWA